MSTPDRRFRSKAPGSASDWLSFTPTVTAETGTLTSASGSIRFVVMGSTVHYTATIVITTAGTGTNGLRFTLPVNADGTSVNLGSGREFAVVGHQCSVTRIAANLAQIVRYDNATIIASGRQIAVSGTYEKD